MNEQNAIENAGEDAAQEVSALTDALALTGDYRLDWWKWLLIGFAVLLLLYLVIRLSLYIFKIIGAIMCVACGVAGGYLAQAVLNPLLAERLPENVVHLSPIISGTIGFLLFYGIAAAIVLLIRKPAQPLAKQKE